MISSRLRLYAPPVVWAILIWIVSSIPANDLPSVKIFSIDKLAHMGVYLILGILVNNVLRHYKARRGTIVLIYLLLVVNAGLDEAHQVFIPGRSVSIWDFVANATGLSLACLWSLKTVKQ